MKLVIAIVQDQDAGFLVEELTKKNFRVTRLTTSGGFLKAGNTTLLMGVEEEDLAPLLDIIEENCKSREVSTHINPMNMPGESFIPYPITVKVGGATVFVLDVADYKRF
ncbi:MAG: cyclic-di-AMP receptor [Tissierellia bacterium]|nr:cyclic-di-AMP receptor [Tissierellia bacterium]